MARPRKPTALIALTGGLAHNKKRYESRKHEPKPTGPIGEPPAEMDVETARCWREIVAEAPPGVLTNADRGILAVAADLRLHAEQGSPVEHEGETHLVTDAKKLALLIRCYVEMGMTPASRSRVQAKPVEVMPANQFAAV